MALGYSSCRSSEPSIPMPSPPSLRPLFAVLWAALQHEAVCGMSGEFLGLGHHMVLLGDASGSMGPLPSHAAYFLGASGVERSLIRHRMGVEAGSPGVPGIGGGGRMESINTRSSPTV